MARIEAETNRHCELQMVLLHDDVINRDIVDLHYGNVSLKH
jgi:hypothetical protein